MMLEDELTRLLDEFQAQVLVLLTRAISDAFEQALAPSGGRKAKATASAPKQPLLKHHRSRRPKVVQTTVGQEVLSNSDGINQASAVANSEVRKPRAKRSKGPSRNEIDRLVQAGLASRLEGEKSTSTATEASVSSR